MTSFFSLFVGLPILLTLPASFKLTLIALSGFTFFIGFKPVEREQAQVDVQMGAQVGAVLGAAPDLVVPKVHVKQAKPVKIKMDLNGEYSIDGEKISKIALTKKLQKMAKLARQPQITLEADTRAPVQLISNAMKLCKTSGIGNVTFVAKAAVQPGEAVDTP